MGETQEFHERVGRIDGLVQKLEAAADPSLRATARELIQSLMELHGAGLERVLEIVSKGGEAGAEIVRSFGRDELVSSLLILYDLHPESYESRVKRGIDKAQRKLVSRGASVEVLAIGEDRIHLRIQASGSGCGSTGRDLESAVREALYEVAPDALEVVIEGGQEQRVASGFVPLASLHMANGSAATPLRPGRP